MKKIYLDANNICHLNPIPNGKEIETSIFDEINDNAVECYRFIPEQNFVQCIDSKTSFISTIQSEYLILKDRYEEIMEVLDNDTE